MIKVYDKFGNKLRSPEVIELQWNRKYYETGDFVLYLSARNYSPDFQYIKVEDRPETGIVQKTVYEEKPEGEFVTLSGYFLDAVLEWGTPLKPIYTLGYTDTAFRVLLFWSFAQHSKRLSESLGGSPVGGILQETPVLYETLVSSKEKWPDRLIDEDNYQFSTEKSAGEHMRDLLKPNGMSLLCTPTFGLTDRWPLLGVVVHPVAGRDLRDKVFFGSAFGNVSKIEFVKDFSPCRSHIIGYQEVPEGVTYSNMRQVQHDGKSVNVIVEELRYILNDPEGLGNCHPEKLIFTNAENVEQGNEASVRAQMKREIRLEMLNHYKEEQISVDTLQDRFYYMKDYDLGDICTLSIDEIQTQFTSRIIEVHEVYSGNKIDVQLVLGTQTKRKYRRVI